MAEKITVTAETYGNDCEESDVIVVRVDGVEVGAYCIVEDAERERLIMKRMVEAIATAAKSGAEVCDG